MSVTPVKPTHRQCPRCRKIQPLQAAVCDGCGRRFQVPAPDAIEFEDAPVSGVYAGIPRSRTTAMNARTAAGPGVSAWWGPAAAALFVTPLGWVLLPLALLLCVVTAALSLTVLPLLLGVIASVRLGSYPRTSRHKLWLIPITLIVALGLNLLLWHTVHQLAFTNNTLR
jgi:hypothetical protein